MGETPEKSKGGRKTKWRKAMIEEAYLYCLEHHGTDRDLANELGIGYRTLYEYMEKYPQFLQAIQDGRKKWRQNGCGEAVQSVYKMMKVQIVDVPKIRQKKKLVHGQLVVVERTETMVKHVLWPNLKAIMFILLNQDPDNWRRNPEPSGDAGPSPAEVIRQALKEFDDMHQPVPAGG